MNGILEAVAFCRWMGEVLGRNCRLPTEVEWEKAAGAGDGREELEGTAERITRGGSWHSPDFNARISARGMNDPAFQDNDLGFRIVFIETD